jgi:hypothetical protein
MNKKALIELAKSFGRFIWFGLLGLIVAFLTALAAGSTFTDMTVVVLGQTINIGFIIVAGIAFISKGIDKYIHENDNIKLEGIAPKFLQK